MGLGLDWVMCTVHKVPKEKCSRNTRMKLFKNDNEECFIGGIHGGNLGGIYY